MSLNAWLDRTWSQSWPEETAAADLYRLNLWKELAEKTPPPSPLVVDTNLCALLDENYAVMIRHDLDPTSGGTSTPLVQWRRTVSGAFKEALRSAGFFHPSRLPTLVRKAIIEGKIVPPERISITGLESPSPLEAYLFATLESYSNVLYLSPTAEGPTKIEAIALPSPEQECLYLTERLVEDARTVPLHRIGVVIPAMDRYLKRLERSLRDVMADPPPQGSNWFNITKGVPLIETHLMNAALLPLRLIVEGESRELLLSLFLSPYYGCWQGRHNRIARADVIWRRFSADGGFDYLLGLLKREDPGKYDLIPSGSLEQLSAFLHMLGRHDKQRGAFWTEKLRELWRGLAFPVISDEKDTVDFKGLEEIISEIDRHLHNTPMTGAELLDWLRQLASRKTVQIGAPEDAGIQIMGSIESRGLAFDRLYVLGMDERSIPEPVRPLPLLDPGERRKVQGGTAESQYNFARRTFDHLMTLAPEITLIRAEQEELKPLAPSPFWPSDQEERRSIDIWNTPDPAWMRAKWLRDAHKGMDEEICHNISDEVRISENCLPESISTSRFHRALTCPYLFFVETVLAMEPLEEIEPDTSPREKGNRIHRVLALFTKRLREENIDPSTEEAVAILAECVEETLRDVAKKPQWNVERRRWLGDEGEPSGGILRDWLARESENRLEGWNCVAEETSFEGLNPEGLPLSLKGKIDRIDLGGDQGIRLWDYKTGNTPSVKDVVERFKEPQLPVYLMALMAGKLPSMNPFIRPERPFSVGYIGLKSSGDIRFSPVGRIMESMDNWMEIIKKLGKILGEGSFAALPFPVSEEPRRHKTCEKCPVLTLCKVGVLGLQATNGKEESDEETE